MYNSKKKQTNKNVGFRDSLLNNRRADNVQVSPSIEII